MLASILVFLQIIKVFLDLWREKDATKAAQKADVAKEIVDAFATADPKEEASKLNASISDIRANS